jgi:hypothetical protein
MPSSTPGQTSDKGQKGSQPSSGQPSGSQSPGGASGGGEPSSYELPDLGGGPAGGIPDSDSSPAGQPGTPGEQAGDAEPGWEDQQAAGGGDDGWETSNQLPGGETADIPPMPTERGAGNSSESAEGGDGGDAALDEALKDFDGDILAEREVIRARANETAGSTTQAGTGGTGQQTSSGSGEVPGIPAEGTAGDARGGPVGIPSNRNTPPPPGPAVAGANVPDDIPDAKDDDIIARQLREAAMQETDPELKEKLWDEYRRYKGI